MRRAASIAVLLVVFTGVLAPLAQGSATSVPACCRADGKHRCTGMLGTGGVDGFRSQSDSCPYKISPVVLRQTVGLLTSAPSALRVRAAEPVALPRMLAVRVTVSGDPLKRGPPLS